MGDTEQNKDFNHHLVCGPNKKRDPEKLRKKILQTKLVNDVRSDTKEILNSEQNSAKEERDTPQVGKPPIGLLKNMLRQIETAIENPNIVDWPYLLNNWKTRIEGELSPTEVETQEALFREMFNRAGGCSTLQQKCRIASEQFHLTRRTK